MAAACAHLGTRLSKSQVDRDYQEGAPRHSARAFLAWRAAFRELGRTADSRIDRAQTPALTHAEAAASASQEAEGGTGEKPSVGSGEAPPGADDAEPADEHTLAFRRDRATNERIKSERAQLELDQLRGASIPAAVVADERFTSMRIVRDRVEMVAPRVAADLHAVILASIPEEHRAVVAAVLELHAFERRLADALRDALGDAAAAIEEAKRDDDDPDAA